MDQFPIELAKVKSERKTLTTYLGSQGQTLDKLIESVLQDTFSQIFPKILGTDTK